MSMAIPTPPKDVSPDGKEIWSWADKLSDAAHKAHEIRTLSQQIKNMETQCGSCSMWMTKQCPRESHSNVTGRNYGPSSKAIKCSLFTMGSGDAALLNKAKEKLLSLQEKAP